MFHPRINRRVSWQHSDTDRPRPRLDYHYMRSPHLQPEKLKWNFLSLFIHSWKGTNKDKPYGARVLVFVLFFLVFLAVHEWINRKQRGISCIGSSPVGIFGIRSITAALFLINWLQEWDDLHFMNFLLGAILQVIKRNRFSSQISQALPKQHCHTRRMWLTCDTLEKQILGNVHQMRFKFEPFLKSGNLLRT